VAGGEHVRRTDLRDIEVDRRIDRVPESEIIDFESLRLQPLGEVARDQRTAGKAEEVEMKVLRSPSRRDFGHRLLEPFLRTVEDLPPAHPVNRAGGVGAEMRARAGLEMQNLFVILDTEVAHARDVRVRTGDSLSGALEE